MAKKDHFVALSECHFMNPQTLSEMHYYPNVNRWWASVDGVMRAWAGRDLTSEDAEWPAPVAEELIKYMDEAGVDVCFCLREGMMDISGQTVAMSTNGFMMQQIAPYPDRMYLATRSSARSTSPRTWGRWTTGACGPSTRRRASSTSHSPSTPACPTWCRSRASTPTRIPSTRCSSTSRSSRSSPTTWPGPTWYERSPYRGYHAIGTALQWVDPSKIVMGLDLPFDDTKRVVDWVRNLEMPEELQKNYGYPEITDEIRAGILGENLARLAKIEPKKRVK
jgi:predicted TIM-barrel fold metal-dependent hydrolase